MRPRVDGHVDVPEAALLVELRTVGGNGDRDAGRAADDGELRLVEPQVVPHLDRSTRPDDVVPVVAHQQRGELEVDSSARFSTSGANQIGSAPIFETNG